MYATYYLMTIRICTKYEKMGICAALIFFLHICKCAEYKYAECMHCAYNHYAICEYAVYVTGFVKTGLIAGVRNYSYSPFSSAK